MLGEEEGRDWGRRQRKSWDREGQRGLIYALSLAPLPSQKSSQSRAYWLRSFLSLTELAPKAHEPEL